MHYLTVFCAVCHRMQLSYMPRMKCKHKTTVLYCFLICLSFSVKRWPGMPDSSDCCFHFFRCKYGWVYHKELRQWVKRAPNTTPLVKTTTYEQGLCYLFDANIWDAIPKVNVRKKFWQIFSAFSDSRKKYIWKLVAGQLYSPLWRYREDTCPSSPSSCHPKSCHPKW